jgi:[acyl-carrier-protein] S-malonyltransferase
VKLGFIVGTNTSDYDPTCAEEFHAEHEVFRTSLAGSAEHAGTTVEALLSTVPDELREQERYGESGLRLTAVLFGIFDVLVGVGLIPEVVGGLSLGALVTSCFAGGLNRPDLFRVLEATRSAPGPSDDAPPEATALAFVAPDDPTLGDGGGRPGVYVGGDLGRPDGGDGRLVMLSGHRAALEAVAAERPEGVVTVIPTSSVAVHTPLRAPARDAVAPTIGDVAFHDPGLALCSCFERVTVTSGNGVRDLFLRNMIDRFDLPAVLEEMVRHDVGLVLVLGPTLPAGVLEFPMPVVHVDSPAHVADAVGAAVELGIQFGTSVPATIPTETGARA